MPRHVRHRVPRQRRPPPDPALRRLRRPPAAQGLREGARAAARARTGRERHDALDRDASPNPVRPAFDTPSATTRSSSTSGRRTRPRTARCRSSPSSTASVSCAPTCICGYLHRGFEKECESHTWHNLIPYVDRLNYCSALINDFAYCEAVEKLMGIEITPRCRYLRTLLSEYSRIADHLTCIAAALMELGAMTAFLYLVMIRDYMYEHLADLTGARVTYTYGRIGGLARDLPDGWLERLDEILGQYEDFVGRVHGLMDRNRIFIDRMRDVGVDLDGRRDQLGLHRPDPALDRRAARPAQGHAVPRLRRARLRGAGRHQRRQLRPLLRADARDGRVGAHDPPARGHAARRARSTSTTAAARSPTSSSSTREIESLINHFKLVMDGPQVPGGRGLHRARGAQRRARLLPRQHRRRARRTRSTCARRASCTWAACTDARRLPARRHRPDLRLGQHDRRRVRPLSMTSTDEAPDPRIREAGRRATRRASSPRSCCRACAASRRTAASSPTSDIDGARRVPRRAAHPDRGGAVVLHPVPAQARSAAGTCRSAATCPARCAAPSG